MHSGQLTFNFTFLFLLEIIMEKVDYRGYYSETDKFFITFNHSYGCHWSTFEMEICTMLHRNNFVSQQTDQITKFFEKKCDKSLKTAQKTECCIYLLWKASVHGNNFLSLRTTKTFGFFTYRYLKMNYTIASDHCWVHRNKMVVCICKNNEIAAGLMKN